MTDPPTDTPEPTLDEIARGLFFIVGTGRCGTTLLQAMLNAHPRLHIPPETHFFARLDPCRLIGHDVIGKLAIERYVRRAVRSARWNEFGIDESELRDAIKSGARDASTLLPWLLRRTSPVGEFKRLGEKTPRHAFYMTEIDEDFPDSKIIHCVRDPRDVVHSMKSRAWSAGDSPYKSAARCRDVYETVPPQGVADHVHEVRYEDLIRDPEGTLRRVCDFLGEPYDPAMLRYDELGSAAYHAREESWKGLARKPLDRARIGRYRDGLSDAEVRTVEWVVGEHLERFGFSQDGSCGDLSMGERVLLRLRRFRERLIPYRSGR